MATRTVLVTPRGRASYPHLNTPDTKFSAEGVYTVKLIVPTAIAETVIEQIDAAHAEAVKQAAKDNPKLKKVKEADLPYRLNEENDEETVFNFKMKASYKKGDEVISMRPALFDAKGKPLSKDTKIGGGSILRVSFEPVPFYTATVGAGVSLRLKAVQVIELRTFGGGSADSFGFEAEEGYEGQQEETAGGQEFAGEEPSGAEEDTTGSDF